MARLSDVPLVVRRVGLLKFARRVWNEVTEDHLLTWGAALAYSWLFAVFPFLIFLLSLLPYLPDAVVAEAGERIREALYAWLPYSADTLWTNIKGVLERPRGQLLSIGLLVTLWAASGGVNMTMTALDRCYEAENARSLVRRRAIAILLTVVVASLVLGVLLLIPVGNLITKLAMDTLKERNVPTWLVAVSYVLRYAVALLLMFLVVGIMYYSGVGVKQRWRLISPGSIFTIAVWILLAFAFRWYVQAIGRESYNRTYGTVGGVALLLLFFYLDAVVLMIGAEINSEIDFEVLGVPRGSLDFTVKPQPFFADSSQPAAAIGASSEQAKPQMTRT